MRSLVNVCPCTSGAHAALGSVFFPYKKQENAQIEFGEMFATARAAQFFASSDEYFQ